MATRILEVLFQGRDLGVVATINQIRGSLTNLGRLNERVSKGMSSTASMLERQWRAVGVTFRYAVAGLAVAKIYQAIQAYTDFNQQLGYLNLTLGETKRATAISVDQINNLGQSALNLSTKYIQPLSDVMQSFNNIAQSIPGLDPRRIPEYGAVEARAALVTGLDPRTLGATALGLGTAFMGRQRMLSAQGPATLEKILSMFIHAGRTMPKTTFEELAAAAPQLAAGGTVGQFNLPQALSIMSIVQQTIPRVQTNVLWTRQLMTRLRNPSKTAQKLFAQAFGGLTGPALLGHLANMPGTDVLNQLLVHAFSLPGGPLFGQNTQGQSTNKIMSDFMNRQGLKPLDIKGPAMAFLEQSIGGRAQSMYALDAFIKNIGQYNTTLQGFVKANQKMQDEVNTMRQRMPLQEMSNAFNNATTALMNGFNPAISEVAGKLTKVSTFISQDIVPAYDKARRGMATGENKVFSLLGLPKNFASGPGGQAINTGLLALGSVLAYGGLRKIGTKALGRIPGLGKSALEKAMEAEATVSAAAGVANGTYQAPFWVIIHPLSKAFIDQQRIQASTTAKNAEADAKAKAEGQIENKIKSKVVDAAEKAAGGAAAAGGWRAIASGAARAGLNRAGLFARGATLPAAVATLVYNLGGSTEARTAPKDINTLVNLHDRLAKTGMTPVQNDIFNLYKSGRINATQALRQIQGVTPGKNFSQKIWDQVMREIGQGLQSSGKLGPPTTRKQLLDRSLLMAHSGEVNRAFRTGAAAGIMGANPPDTYNGAVDIHLILEPTGELKKIVKTSEGVVHTAPTSFWKNHPPPPTARGKQKTYRKVK